jgi:hypothetical protein
MIWTISLECFWKHAYREFLGKIVQIVQSSCTQDIRRCHQNWRAGLRGKEEE